MKPASQQTASNTVIQLAKKDGHQVGAKISVPAKQDLLEEVLSREQLTQIFNAIGENTLVRIASNPHTQCPSDAPGKDFTKVAQEEKNDLQILKSAISDVTGIAVKKVWIIGFASELSTALLQWHKKL